MLYYFLLLFRSFKEDAQTIHWQVLFSELSLTSRKGLKPESLPPIEDAAWQHSLRVYLQITYWKTLLDTDIDPVMWGWMVKDGHLVPVMTNQVRYLPT